MITVPTETEALGCWWRYDRYELRGGSICPARGARLQRYDPWTDYEEARRSQATPYLSLLTLLERFTEAGVLEWCAGHGLLGVLPHRARMVTLAPDFVHGTDHRGRQHTLGFTQLRY